MIKLIKSSFYNEKKTKSELIKFIQKTDVFSMNKECKKFEEAFAKKQGREYALFCTSGSSANLLLLQALLNLGRIKIGDSVGFSALTWATNVMPIIQLGLIPVAIDCEINTLNVSPQKLKECKKKIKALFITNVLGFCDDLKSISEYCNKNNIILLEDNCESLGSKAYGKMLGNFGLASTFSTFVGHHLSTIEGGLVCTDDDDLNHMLLMVRAHGWDRNLNLEKQKHLREKHNIDNFFAKYTFFDLAYNSRPTELNGILGNIQLQYWDEIVNNRAKNFLFINNFIEKNEKMFNYVLPHLEIISNFAIPIIFRHLEDYNEYKEKFNQAEIEIRPIIAGDITKQPFYKKYVSEEQICPNSSLIHKQGFYFGNNPEMTKKEINILANLLK